MAYVVIAYWHAQEGHAEDIANIIKIMTPLSRQEPGCLYYQAQRSVDDPNLFILYEQYADQAAYEAHMVTPHFERYVKGQAITLLEKRDRQFGETV